MPVIGTLTSGSLSPTGMAQQAMIAVLKATTAISGSSFEVQQTVSGPAGAFIGGRNNSIPGHSSFAADGDYLVTGDGDFSNVYVWNLSDGSLHMTVAAPSLPSGTGNWGWQIDIHGDYFIAGNGGDYATVHNVSTGALITTITGAARNVAINENYAVGVQLGGFNPGSGAGTIKIFELATSTLTYMADPNYDSSEYFGGGIQMMDISGDNLILSPNNGPIVTVHDIPTALSNGNLNTASLTINPTVSYFESLTAGGNYLALGRTSVQDGSILIYDLTTGTLLHTLTAPIGADSDFGDTMHIKGDYLVVGNRAWYGSGANLAAVYDLTTGTLLQTFTESDATNTSTWHYPLMGGAFGSAVAITDSKTIIGSRTGAENSSGGGSFIIYSNPSQAAESAGSAGSIDWSNVTLAHTLDNPNASGGTSDHNYFSTAAISNTYAIVGAQDSSGSTTGNAYIFDVSDGSLAYTLNNPNQGATAGNNFGSATSISDTHAIVGVSTETDATGIGSGIAYIYDLSDGSIAHTLVNPNPYTYMGSGYDAGFSNDQFGIAVAISGDYAIVGASSEDDQTGGPNGSMGNQSGKAYIFNVSDGSLEYTLDNPNTYGTGAQDYFGDKVAISSTHAIAGARTEDGAGGDNSGAAYIYDLSDGSLTYTLTDPNAYGTSAADYFGGSVAISSTHAIIGAWNEEDAGGDSVGAAYIYDLSNGSLLYTLYNPNVHGTSTWDSFGWSVSISDTHAVVSARGESDASGNESGKAYIYDLSDGSLVSTLDNPNAYGTSADDKFGDLVGISGGNIIVGAMMEDDASGTNSGKAYIFSAPPAAPVSSGWTFDLSNVTYDIVSFSVNQDNNPASIAFNNDGTKMYMMGGFHKNIHQYTLSTGFDLSTASYDNVNFYVGSQDNAPQHMKFNNDGTKMYISGMQRDKIHQYSLTTGFDLSTASYDNVTFVLPAFTYGFTFNNDGTKMYSNGDSGTLRQHSLTTAFDLSTASYDNVNFSASQSHSPNDMWFNSDGTKMYILFAGGEDDVHQYSLTTGFDMSTASYDNVSFSVGSQETNPTGLVISSDGTKMYAVGANNDTVYQYTTGSTQLSAPVSSGWTFDLSNVSYDNASVSLYSELPSGVYRMIFNNDGTKMYAVGNTSSAPWHKIAEYSLSTAYDITTSSYNNVDLPITSQISHPVSIRFNNDGTKLYIIGGDPRRISQYSLSVAFDLSTATYSGVDIDPGDGHSLHFNPDGTKMYTVRSGSGTGDVKQYSLSTGFDISTASYDNISFDVTSQMSSPSDIIFNPDGTKMYINDYGTKNIFQYSLSSGFDLSTASYDNASFLVSQQHLFYGMAINGDGTKLYTTGSWQPNVDIHQYSTGL